jgi:hypothetical protein
MFGLFKKKPKQPSLLEMLANTPPEKREALKKQFEEFAQGESNEVEEVIAHLHGGQTEYLARLGSALERSTVAVMVKDPKDIQNPLIVQNPSGYPVLMVFTQDKRANKALEKHPESRHLAHVSFKDLLARVGPEMGLVINPYAEVLSFRFNPQQLNALKGCMLKDLPPPEAPRSHALNHFVQPLNDLERDIIAFHRREIPVQKFLEKFFKARVSVLCDHEQIAFNNQGPGLVQKPHLYSIIQPDVVFLAVFSHMDRAKIVKDPKMRFTVESVAEEFLLSFETSHVGLVINPHWDINFHWSPQQLAEIKGMLRR